MSADFEVTVTDTYDKEDDFHYSLINFKNDKMSLTFGEPYLISNEYLLKCQQALEDSSISASIGGGGNSYWNLSINDCKPALDIDISGLGEDLFTQFILTKEQTRFIIEELLKIDKK